MVRQRWDALWKSSCLNPGKNQVGAVWSLGDASSFVTSVVFPGYPQVLQLGFSFCFGCNERSLWRICVCCLSLGLKGFCGFLGKHQILLHRMLTAHSCFALCEMVKINNVTAVLKVSGEADTHWTCTYSFPMDVYHLPVAVLWLWCESAGSPLEVCEGRLWEAVPAPCWPLICVITFWCYFTATGLQPLIVLRCTMMHWLMGGTCLAKLCCKVELTKRAQLAWG